MVLKEIEMSSDVALEFFLLHLLCGVINEVIKYRASSDEFHFV
jgi:hypothetical protein